MCLFELFDSVEMLIFFYSMSCLMLQGLTLNKHYCFLTLVAAVLLFSTTELKTKQYSFFLVIALASG